MQKNINRINVAAGLEFPHTVDEIDLFNSVYKDYAFKLDQSVIDPVKILKSVREASYVVTNIDYYKRTLLAAEIVYQLHMEATLGHVKLQKLIYLCQKTGEMQLPTNFLRQAMGPYDNRLMRSIDKQLMEKKWFEYKKDQLYKYQPLERIGQHQIDFLKYFSCETEKIQFILKKFKSVKTDRVEIVATLYACLDNLLSEKVIFSEALLIQRFYAWSEEKKKFSEKDITGVFIRMKETGIIPRGYNF